MRAYLEIIRQNSKGYPDGKASGIFVGLDEKSILEKAHTVFGDTFTVWKFETLEEKEK